MKREHVDKLAKDILDSTRDLIIKSGTSEYVDIMSFYSGEREIHIKYPLYIYDYENRSVIIDTEGVIHDIRNDWSYRRIVPKKVE